MPNEEPQWIEFTFTFFRNTWKHEHWTKVVGNEILLHLKSIAEWWMFNAFNAWINIKASFRIVMLCFVTGNQIHWTFISNKWEKKPQKPFEQTLIKNGIYIKSTLSRKFTRKRTILCDKMAFILWTKWKAQRLCMNVIRTFSFNLNFFLEPIRTDHPWTPY